MAVGVGFSVGPFWWGKRLGGGRGSGGAAGSGWAADAGAGLVVLVVAAAWVVGFALWAVVAGVLVLWGVPGWAGVGFGQKREPFRAVRWLWAQGVTGWALPWRAAWRRRETVRLEAAGVLLDTRGVLLRRSVNWAGFGGLVLAAGVVCGAFYGGPTFWRQRFVEGDLTPTLDPAGRDVGHWEDYLLDIGDNGSGLGAVVWWNWALIGVGVLMLVWGAVCRVRAGFAAGAEGVESLSAPAPAPAPAGDPDAEFAETVAAETRKYWEGERQKRRVGLGEVNI